MKRIELTAICDLGNGVELGQTGIYVFETATLKECIELMENGIRGHKVTRIEFKTGYENDKEV